MTVQGIIHEEYRRQARDAFVWGERDCLMWCADVAAAILGRDPAKALRGRYRSLRGARRVMRNEGWADLGDVARAMFERIPVAMARTGDWVHIVNEDGTDTLAVVVNHMAVARTETQGLGQVPVSRAVAAFRVA